MILFILEGEKTEKRILNSLLLAYPEIRSNDEQITISWGSDIDSLYQKIRAVLDDEAEPDILRLLKDLKRKDIGHPIHSIERSSDISQIYLFFDYDFQRKEQGQYTDKSKRYQYIEQLLELFSDETLYGKLYISYPMVEALFHTCINKNSEDIDEDYKELEHFQSSCPSYKEIVRQYNAAIDNLLTGDNSKNSQSIWRILIKQNIRKAYWLCSGIFDMPQCKEIISQQNIHQKQWQSYIDQPLPSVSVLSAFPLFIYDYFPMDKLGKA